MKSRAMVTQQSTQQLLSTWFSYMRLLFTCSGGLIELIFNVQQSNVEDQDRVRRNCACPALRPIREFRRNIECCRISLAKHRDPKFPPADYTIQGEGYSLGLIEYFAGFQESTPVLYFDTTFK